jgi:hypothetical protein
MAADRPTLEINEALAERLRARAKAAGQTVEEYALDILRRAVEEPGLAESEPPWSGAPAQGLHDGFGEDDDAYADYIDRICDEAERTGGVPWEEVQARLRNFGQRR